MAYKKVTPTPSEEPRQKTADEKHEVSADALVGSPTEKSTHEQNHSQVSAESAAEPEEGSHQTGQHHSAHPGHEPHGAWTDQPEGMHYRRGRSYSEQGAADQPTAPTGNG